MASFPPGSLSQPTRRLPITVVKKARNLWNPSFDIIDGLFELTKSYRFQDCNLLFIFFFLNFPREETTNLTEEIEAQVRASSSSLSLPWQCKDTPPPPPQSGGGGALKSKGLCFLFRSFKAYLSSFWSLLLPSRSLPEAQIDEGKGGEGQLILQNGWLCQAKS